jgi:hypothetical protein
LWLLVAVVLVELQTVQVVVVQVVYCLVQD